MLRVDQEMGGSCGAEGTTDERRRKMPGRQNCTLTPYRVESRVTGYRPVTCQRHDFNLEVAVVRYGTRPYVA